MIFFRVTVLLLVSLFLGCVSQAPECNPPRIRVGDECCLDSDNDGVCDKHQATTTLRSTTTLKTTLTDNISEECELLFKQAEDEDGQVRGTIAFKKMPEECACQILSRLSHDEDCDVRFHLSRNPNIPRECACEILTRLSKDDVWSVRDGVARNYHIPEECLCDILKRLSQDDDEYVLREVADYPHIPDECACQILNKLSKDENSRVRDNALKNSQMKNCG
jgi:hypothetical protein